MDPRDNSFSSYWYTTRIILREIIPRSYFDISFYKKKKKNLSLLHFFITSYFFFIRCFGRTSFVQTDDKRRSNSLGFFVEIRVQLRGFESQKKNSQRHKRRFGGYYERSDGFHKCLFTTAWPSRGGKVNSLRVQKSRFLRRRHDIGSSSRVSKVQR